MIFAMSFWVICSFVVSSSGIELIKGTVVLDRDVILDVNSTSIDNGIILGNCVAADDIIIHLNPGCTITHRSGHWAFNNGSLNSMESSSKTARLVRQEGSNVYVQQDLELSKLTVELVSNSVPAMQVTAGKTLSYKDASIVLPDIEFDVTSNQYNASTYLLNGNDLLFFTKGSLPLALLIENSGNIVRGNCSITGPITLQDSSTELSLGITN